MTRLSRDADGWSLHLMPVEGQIVSALPEQLQTLLENPDANQRIIDRLFPASYADPEEERLNRELLGASLMEERRQTVEAVAALLKKAERDDEGLTVELDPTSIDLLLRFVNDVRLVIATDLGVDDNLDDRQPVDPDDPDSPRWALLEYLGGLEAVMVEALSREV